MRRDTVLEGRKKRSLQQRMVTVHTFLCIVLLIFVARLLELQVIKGSEYLAQANNQHYGGIVLPAKRGEILSVNSKSGETSILATNTTLDLVYVDPLITDDPTLVAETLADLLVTEDTHTLCSAGHLDCPRELIPLYGPAFDPMQAVKAIQTEGTLLEPLPQQLPSPDTFDLPDLTEVRRLFARDIENRIQAKTVTFVPLKYGATKVQLQQVADLGIRGVEIVSDTKLIYANPENVDQTQIQASARKLSAALDADPMMFERNLVQRPLRYVAVMRRLPPILSSKIREKKQTSLQETLKQKSEAATREAAAAIQDPLRSIALIPEHWRFYPDTTIGSHVIGFLNNTQDAQYGIERTYDVQLRGQEGLISAVADLQGGQIVTGDQTVIDPKDGDTIILTIDRFIQKEVETLMDAAVKEYEADSGQAIVMDPATGRILAMVNAPLFDGNNYGDVYSKEPIFINEDKRKEIVVELYHPDTRLFIVKAYHDDLFTEEGRVLLSEEKQKEIQALEELYDLRDIVRYYLYIGEDSRREVFPTDRPDVWLKYENNMGVGAYLNRNIQEIYEPGSVLKPVTMAIAIDQGEVTAEDRYQDSGPVRVDEYTIKNALNTYYGDVNMTDCIGFSINTCMTSVSEKLGKKLFHRMLTRFGIGQITGIELEDELPGEMLPWRQWSNALLATSAYGQGISATPLQVITAFSALANGGKLMYPTIVDRIIRNDGTVQVTQPRLRDQVITPQTADTITAMLVSTSVTGFAKAGRPAGYRIAGKTGTSQVAGPGGKYVTGTGSTITSFAGYAPVDHPRFAILVKFDKPRKDEFGVRTAAPVFKAISEFLFKYYGIPPDEK